MESLLVQESVFLDMTDAKSVQDRPTLPYSKTTISSIAASREQLFLHSSKHPNVIVVGQRNPRPGAADGEVLARVYLLDVDLLQARSGQHKRGNDWRSGEGGINT